MHEPLGTLSHKRHGTTTNLYLSGYKILVREGCKRENVDIYFLETLLFLKSTKSPVQDCRLYTQTVRTHYWLGIQTRR